MGWCLSSHYLHHSFWIDLSAMAPHITRPSCKKLNFFYTIFPINLTGCVSVGSTREHDGWTWPAQAWTPASAGGAQGNPQDADRARNRASSCSHPALQYAPVYAVRHYLKKEKAMYLSFHNFHTDPSNEVTTSKAIKLFYIRKNAFHFLFRPSLIRCWESLLFNSRFI